MAQGRLQQCFATWRAIAAFVRPVRQRLGQLQAQQARRALQQSLQGWRALAGRKGRQRDVLALAAGRLRNRQAAAAFSRWVEFVVELQVGAGLEGCVWGGSARSRQFGAAAAPAALAGFDALAPPLSPEAILGAAAASHVASAARRLLPGSAATPHPPHPQPFFQTRLSHPLAPTRPAPCPLPRQALRVKLQAALGHMRSSKLAAAFHGWAEAAEQLRGRRATAQRALTHMASSAAARALGRWRGLLDAQAQALAAAGAFRASGLRRRAGAALRAWREQAGTLRKYRLILRHFTGRQLAAVGAPAFWQWRQYAWERCATRRALVRFWSGLLVRAFNTWAGAVEQRKEAAARELSGRILGLRALQAWRLGAALVRGRRGRQQGAVLLHGATLLRKALFGWVGRLWSRRVLQGSEARRQARALQGCFSGWLAAAAEGAGQRRAAVLLAQYAAIKTAERSMLVWSKVGLQPACPACSLQPVAACIAQRGVPSPPPPPAPLQVATAERHWRLGALGRALGEWRGRAASKATGRAVLLEATTILGQRMQDRFFSSWRWLAQVGAGGRVVYHCAPAARWSKQAGSCPPRPASQGAGHVAKGGEGGPRRAEPPAWLLSGSSSASCRDAVLQAPGA
jgi:hypothetical protein